MEAALSDAAALLAVAMAYDLFVGEPPVRLHPVVWIGNGITLLLKFAPRRSKSAQLFFGACVATGLPALTFALATYALALASVSPMLTALVGAWLLTSSFSIQALGAAGERVQRYLYLGDLEAARGALGHLCSRDASDLSESEVAGATIESIAENACDSFVAPILFYALFGVPGAIAYRCINTLDSRLGYRGALEYLGKASARLDDLANLIPARASALLFLLAGRLQGFSIGDALRTWRRDASKTESPNAGQSMSVMAGLLGVQLDKRGAYSLGDSKRPASAVVIAEAWDIVYASLLLFAAAVAALLSLRGPALG